jgi:hypothetical protein
MAHADQVLADEVLVTTVYQALGKQDPKSKSRGRQGIPAEVVLRLLILQHIRNWSYGVQEPGEAKEELAVKAANTARRVRLPCRCVMLCRWLRAETAAICVAMTGGVIAKP